jgi:hypothetical protein
MNFDLTEEQKDIKFKIREFCKQEVDVKRMQEIADIAASAKHVEELRAVFPYDLSEKLHDAGLRPTCTRVSPASARTDHAVCNRRGTLPTILKHD